MRLLEALSKRKRREDLATMRSLVNPGGETTVLDIGGGGGSATRVFADGSRKVTVLDPNIRKARFGSRQHRELRFVRARAENLPFRDEAFSRVTAVVSLHHVADIDLVISEIVRVLKRSGRLVVYELHPGPHAKGPVHILGHAFHSSGPTFIGPDELRRRLEARALAVEAARQGVRGYFIVAARPSNTRARAGSEI